MNFTKEEYLKSFIIREEIYTLASMLVECLSPQKNDLSIRDIDYNKNSIEISIYQDSRCGCCNDEHWETITISLDTLLGPEPIKTILEDRKKKKEEEALAQTRADEAAKADAAARQEERDRVEFNRLKAKFGG